MDRAMLHSAPTTASKRQTMATVALDCITHAKVWKEGDRGRGNERAEAQERYLHLGLNVP